MNQELENSDNLEESSNQDNMEIEEIEKILSVDDEFQKLPDESKKKIVRRVGIISEHMHAGPIPDPLTLSKYNEIIPNGADRIMSMAENQQKHRINIETRVVRSNNVQSYLGQIFGFLIGIGALGAGVYLTLHDKPWPGGALSIGAIAALVSVFVIGKKMQRDD